MQAVLNNVGTSNLAPGYSATGNVLYDNGSPYAYYLGLVSYSIGKNYSTTNSFTLTSGATFGSAVVCLSNNQEVPLTVNWMIGTTPFGSDISSGTSPFFNSLQSTGVDAGIYYNSTIALSGQVGSAGTYYLTLSGATNSDPSDSVAWMVDNGSSVASYRYGSGKATSINSEGFTLYGRGSALADVPEPSTWALLGVGMVAVGIVALRRRRALA